MLVAGTRGGFDALGEDGFGFAGASVLGKCLGVHLVAGDVIGVGAEQRAEMSFGGWRSPVFKHSMARP